MYKFVKKSFQVVEALVMVTLLLLSWSRAEADTITASAGWLYVGQTTPGTLNTYKGRDVFTVYCPLSSTGQQPFLSYNYQVISNTSTNGDLAPIAAWKNVTGGALVDKTQGDDFNAEGDEIHDGEGVYTISLRRPMYASSGITYKIVIGCRIEGTSTTIPLALDNITQVSDQ
jgi:hypothetical protein